MFVYLANSCDFLDLHEKRYKINIYYPFGDSFKLYPDPLLNVLHGLNFAKRIPSE